MDEEDDGSDDDQSSSAVEDQLRVSRAGTGSTQNVYSLAKDVEETTPSSNESVSFKPNTMSEGIPSHRILFQVFLDIIAGIGYLCTYLDTAPSIGILLHLFEYTIECLSNVL